MTFANWCRTLCANRFRVSWRCAGRALRMTLRSILNSGYARRERRAFGAQIDATEPPTPLFILGHWRSGTTFVQNLLACDPQFASPTLYEVLFPDIFLLTEDRRGGLARWLVPRLRDTRGLDDMAMGYDVPGEDEFAMACLSRCSPYLMWSFPRGERRYERHITFEGAPEADVARWKAAFVRFVKKLVLRHGLTRNSPGKPHSLVLKSPGHTGRVRLLLEMFPEARFVHVHRHPYEVLHSTRRTQHVMTAAGRFQKGRAPEADEGIIRRYRIVHEAYFAQRGLIAPGRLYEVSLSDLERDPAGQIRAIYGALGLGGLDEALPAVREHLTSVAGHRKRTYPELPKDLKARLRTEWRQTFEAWGYSSA